MAVANAQVPGWIYSTVIIMLYNMYSEHMYTE